MLRRLLSSSGPITRGKSSIFQALLAPSAGALRNDQYLCQPPAAHVPSESGHTSTRPCSVSTQGNSRKSFVKAVRTFISVHGCRARAGDPSARGTSVVNAQLRIRTNQLAYPHRLARGSRGCHTTWDFVRSSPPKPQLFQLPGVKYFLQISPTFQLTGHGGYES